MKLGAVLAIALFIGVVVPGLISIGFYNIFERENYEVFSLVDELFQ